MINFKKLKLLRSAARVERMHTMPFARQQTVGEHTFGALCILDQVCPTASRALIMALLHHDVAEAVTGDVPATAKWKYPKLAKVLEEIECEIEAEHSLSADLTSQERMILRYCDIMDLAIYAIEEYERGDRNALQVAGKCINAMMGQNMGMFSPEQYGLFSAVVKHYHLLAGEKHEGVLFDEFE